MNKIIAEASSRHLLDRREFQTRQDSSLAGDLVTPANPNGLSFYKSFNASAPTVRPTRAVLGHTWYRRAGKRVVDVVFVLATLPVSVPIILLSAIALWFEGGNPFYRQDRLGKGGKRFSIFKLRTMVRDADAQFADILRNDPALRDEWQATQKLKCDPRITQIGRFLRATSLDELPQLWNVLKGEMSLVGPRPMMPEQLVLYGDATAYFALLPGITGPWQVSTRNENLFSCRADLDAQYFRDISLPRDLGLLLQTVNVVLNRTGY